MTPSASQPNSHFPETAVAIIGMAGRFPAARTVDELWANLCRGEESITTFSREELRAAGVPAHLVDHPDHVPAAGVLDGVDEFDFGYFGLSPREAELLDPQQRLFLEHAAAARQHAGYEDNDPSRRVGVFAGAAAPGYLLENLASHADLFEPGMAYQVLLANDKDFLATRASYKLDLRGPSVSVQTACSTSLVAVAMACQALADGECDMALAGGVTVRLPHRVGYLYQPEGILSPDGHCRAFDAQAAGTVPGSGVGVVMLKPLDRALADGDTVHAVIRGWAVNNDGADKVGFTAPSVAGQAAVISEALAFAEVDPADVGYVETHGTGTRLGDPIEIAALTRAFGPAPEGAPPCALGSAKTSIGHLDIAAGVTGLIKAALTVKHGQLPPSLHYTEPNPEIDFGGGRFQVNDRLRDWPDTGAARIAGVSSFGIGGTNAHVVLEQPPAPVASPERPDDPVLLTLSARTDEALDESATNLAAHLESHPELDLNDVAYTLQAGRAAHPVRRCVVAGDVASAIVSLGTPARGKSGQADGAPPVAFLFPGQGAQFPGMAADLWSSPVFRAEVEACCEILSPLLDLDLKNLLLTREPEPGPLAEQLKATRITQPALFVVEYAAARWWMHLGIEPEILLGHSIGEYTAACLAGVFERDDALRIVAARGRLIQALPTGSMLAVPLPAEEIEPLLDGGLALAAVNAPRLCAVSGPHEEIEQLERRLGNKSVVSRRLHTSHAFHSPMMQPAAAEFRRELEQVSLSAPRIPVVSNVTGRLLLEEEARDPEYWVRHLLQPVRFAAGAAEVLGEENRVMLEVGPGDTLTGLTLQVPDASGRTVISSMVGPRDDRPRGEAPLAALGDLWIAGAAPDWEALHRHPRRVPLPTYPFARTRAWVEPGESRARSGGGRIYKRPEMGEWFYLPAWNRAAPLPAAAPPEDDTAWLLLGGSGELAHRLADALRAGGARVWAAPLTAAGGDGNGAASGGALPPVDPDSESGYDALLTALAEVEALPDQVLYLEPLDGVSKGATAFVRLLHLARALSRHSRGRSIRLTLVARGLHEVTGHDLAAADAAPLLGLARVIPQEYPHLACRVVDFDPHPDRIPAREAARLLAEVSGERFEPLVAHRGEHRWLPEFVAWETEPAGEPFPLWSRSAHVLITGGRGRFGLALAEHLARTREDIHLTLVDVASPPDEAHDDPVALRLRRLREQGATVWTATADVADGGAMADVIGEARRRHGPLNGVIHAAGFGGEAAYRTLEESDASLAAAYFRPKVEGLRVLASLLEPDQPELCLVASSLAPVLGGIGLGAFAAADSWADALVHDLRRSGQPWQSIQWEGWEEIVAAEGGGLIGQQQNELMMSLDEVADAFERVAAAPAAPLITVATGDLHARLAQWTRGLGEAGPAAAPGGPRTASAEFQAPRSEAEGTIASIWAEALGVESIGVDDDFFELGGNSLIGLQILSRLRAEFQAELPLRSFFEARTVAGMAEIIVAEQAAGDERYGRIADILAEIEGLSEEEAEVELRDSGASRSAGEGGADDRA